MNNIEASPEASNISDKDTPNQDQTNKVKVEKMEFDPKRKLVVLFPDDDSFHNKINEDSIFKRFVYHKSKFPGEKLIAGKSEIRYRVEKMIGQGSTGSVFVAKDYNFDRDVAIKLPKKTETSKDDFINEAMISASLEHPNIVPIYDLNIDNDGNLYMSMRKINGYSLKKYIDSAKKGTDSVQVMKIEKILLIFLKVCDAVAYAHSKKRIHQDIKPENIMIGDFGEVFLIDWGSSSINDDEICLTPAYMSPEQASAGCADERSDIFCLAATLFHVLTLRFPTSTKISDELWTKRRQGVIDPLTDEERKAIPPPLMAIVMKGLEADPAKRYQSIAEFSHDLQQYQAGLAVSAFKDTLYASFARWYKRNKKSFWLSLLTLFVVFAFGTYIWNEKLKERAYWGSPIYVENFKDNSWKDKWIEYQGAFDVKNGQLVTVPGKGDSYIFI